MNTHSDIELETLISSIVSHADAVPALANPRSFILAGRAVFTVVSEKTGTRYTFKVSEKKMNDGKVLHFVSVLTGSDNTNDYTFLGTIFDRATYRHGNRSPISADAGSAKAFGWIWNRLSAGAPLTGAHIHHEGKCGRCGRALTVPESIASGYGAECLGKIGG